MNKATGLILGAVAAATLSASALAQTTITVSTWGGPNHGINTIVWPTWKSWIEEATEGRVTVEVVHDMGPPAAQMEMVADGIADASWIFHGHMAGRFALTQLPEFPTFENFSSEAASAAYWHTHQEHLAEAGVAVTFEVAEPASYEPDRGFDVVYLGTGVYNHIPTRARRVATLRQVTRLLELDGFVVLAPVLFPPLPALSRARLVDTVRRVLRAAGVQLFCDPVRVPPGVVKYLPIFHRLAPRF